MLAIKGMTAAVALTMAALGVSACSSGGLPGGVSGTCTPVNVSGYVDPMQDAKFTVTASSTVSVASVTVAFYDTSGNEIGSYPFAVDETITAGQTYNGQSPNSIGYLVPGDTTATSVIHVQSCKVVAWAAGQ